MPAFGTDVCGFYGASPSAIFWPLQTGWAIQDYEYTAHQTHDEQIWWLSFEI